MSLATETSNVYTNEPQSFSNLFMGSLQQVVWLLFHPTAWQKFVERIDSNLPPHFCLAELKKTHLNIPIWPKLVLQSFLIGPLFTWVVLVLVLMIFSQVGIGVFLGLLLGIMTGMFFGITVSVASGLVVSIVSTAFFILILGAPNILLVDNLFSTRFGLTFGAIVGMAGYVLSVIEHRGSGFSTGRRWGGLIIGILIGSIGISLVVGVPLIVVTSWQSGAIGGISATLVYGGTPALIFGLAGGLRTRSWRRGLIFGLSSGIVIGLLFGGLFRNVTFGNDVFGLTFLVIFLIVLWAAFLMLYILPFILAERIAGPWSGAIAGLLASQAIHPILGYVFVPYEWLPNLVIGFVTSFLLMSLAWWRPILFFPFLSGWHTILYRFDSEREATESSLFHLHAAFWDELSKFRWAGLDEHLVTVLEKYPVDGEQAIAFFYKNQHRWAARKAQIELDARQLARLSDVRAIAEAKEQLQAWGLEGPASALLRSFSLISQDVGAALYQASTYNQRLAFKAVAERLEALIRDLTRSNEPYAARFQPIAEQWQIIVLNFIEELSLTAERRQEIGNPYVIGVPLNIQQEIFVGRTDITARIENLLIDQQRPPLLLYGQRRMGKTSLLNNLGRLLPDSIIPLFVDLQGPVSFTSDHAGLFYNLARSMIDSAKRQRNIDLPAVARESFQFDPFTAFDEWIDDVESSLSITEGQRVLLALDEFEVLDSALVDGRFQESAVLGTLRHLIQHRLWFKVLLSGSHTLQEFQRWASYFINAQVIHIGYLKEDETRRLIEQPVKGFPLRYRPEASQKILDLTCGHPFLLQLLCSEIITLKNEQEPDKRRLATLDDVEAAVPQAFDVGRLFFADIEFNQLDTPSIEVLRFIASHKEGASVKLNQLQSHFGNGIDVKNSLALLIRRELLEVIDNNYRFQVEMVRRWFAK